MRLLANPVILRAALVFVGAIAAFAIGVLLILRLRRQIKEESRPSRPAESALPLLAYQGVLQQLRSREQELQRMRDEAQQRAAAAESLCAAVLNGVSSGVLVLDSAGLVRQANPAARQLLGFASISHMHLRDIFRETTTQAEHVDLLQCLRDGSNLPQTDVPYTTPAGKRRVLSVSLAALGSGALCLLNEAASAMDSSRREDASACGPLNGEIADEILNSLTIITQEAQAITAAAPGDTRAAAQRIEVETGMLRQMVHVLLRRPASAGDAEPAPQRAVAGE